MKCENCCVTCDADKKQCEARKERHRKNQRVLYKFKKDNPQPIFYEEPYESIYTGRA